MTPCRSFGAYVAADAGAFAIAAGETREVAYSDTSLIGDFALAKAFPFRSGKRAGFRIERAPGSDATDIADRIVAFFRAACGIRPEIAENAQLAEWTVTLVPDGASAGSPTVGICVDAARMSVRGADRVELSRLSRRFLDGLNQMVFPDYEGSGVRMSSEERSFFTFRRM